MLSPVVSRARTVERTENFSIQQVFSRLANELKNAITTSMKTQHASITETNWLKLLREIIYETHKYTRGEIAELLNAKVGGMCSYHCPVRCYVR
jgi:hypothetical protein